jgi:starch synthase (maltosyl-transferring)
MGFNWLYINSVHYPGFSGSLYAVKHHYRINPEFLPPAPRMMAWPPWSEPSENSRTWGYGR